MPVLDLGKILEEIHWEEYAEFDNPPVFATAEEKEQRLQRLFAASQKRSENNSAEAKEPPHGS